MNGWQTILEAASLEEARFRAALGNLRASQAELLRRIVRRNANSRFGIDHSFRNIGTIDDYRAAVPVSSYEAHKGWIDRIAHGENDVLTSQPVIAFEETGGTTSGGKLVPYTVESLLAFRAAVLPSLSDLARRRPGIKSGSIYAAISPAARGSRTTPCGIPVGLQSDAAYLGEDLSAAFASLLAVSPQTAAIGDMRTWKAATIGQLQGRADLSFVSVWSPTFWLELVADLEGDFRSTWPMLDTISCWTHAASARFAEALRAKFGGVHIEPKGLLATESAVTVALGDEEGCVPAVNSAFLEFLDHKDVAHLADELEEGRTYRVVVTTPGGLYRYDTDDLVRCASIRDGIPRLVFEGRKSVTSDLVGEKLEDGFVATALATLPCAAKLVARAVPAPHYELWLDLEDPAPLEGLAEAVEAHLRRNPQYAHARDLGQLRAIKPLRKTGFWKFPEHTEQRLATIKMRALENPRI